jgi:hypothetical protein
VCPNHFMQLFDSDGSLAVALASFIQEGLAEGDAVLIVTTGERWDRVLNGLASRGVPVAVPMQSRRLTFRDSRDLLRQFMRNSGPSPELFEAVVGRAVRNFAARTNRLRIYGDMVDQLAGTGDYASAHRLEILWNQLGSGLSFQLLHGYSALHFGSPHHLEALRIICRCHSGVRSSRDDTLSSGLLDRVAQLPHRG